MREGSRILEQTEKNRELMMFVFFFDFSIIRKAPYSGFLRKEQPSVKRARPPVGWQRTLEQLPQRTTVWAWLQKTKNGTKGQKSYSG
jgi:hypothetical protein